jgi:hypothetical protein
MINHLKKINFTTELDILDLLGMKSLTIIPVELDCIENWSIPKKYWPIPRVVFDFLRELTYSGRSNCGGALYAANKKTGLPENSGKILDFQRLFILLHNKDSKGTNYHRAVTKLGYCNVVK